MEHVMSDKIVVGAKTPLEFIDSLPNGEAKIAAMVVYQMCRILDIANGTIRPTAREVDKLNKSEFNVYWVKRDLETGLLLKYSDGYVETFSTLSVMSNTLYPHQPHSSRFRYELYLGDKPCASDAV